MAAFLWVWRFEDELLVDIDVSSDKWARFTKWLTEEEKQALSQYPPDQLESMHELVDSREGGK